MNRINLLKDVKLTYWPWLDLIMVIKLILSFLVILLVVSVINFAWTTVNKVRLENFAEINHMLKTKVINYEKNYEIVSERRFIKARTNFVLNFLTFLAQKTPNGVWLTSFGLSEADNDVILKGKAYRPEQVAELLKLYDETNFLKEKKLKIIKEERDKDNFINFLLSTDDKLLQNL